MKKHARHVIQGSGWNDTRPFVSVDSNIVHMYEWKPIVCDRITQLITITIDNRQFCIINTKSITETTTQRFSTHMHIGLDNCHMSTGLSIECLLQFWNRYRTTITLSQSLAWSANSFILQRWLYLATTWCTDSLISVSSTCIERHLKWVQLFQCRPFTDDSNHR